MDEVFHNYASFNCEMRNNERDAGSADQECPICEAPPEVMFPDLKRIHRRGSSRIYPPLNPLWSDLKHLKWKLRVMQIDCGLMLDVKATPKGYHLVCPGRGFPIDTSPNLWRTLTDMQQGVEIYRQQRLSSTRHGHSTPPLTPHYE